MKLEKAIELLIEQAEAHQLGIEALKEVERLRSYKGFHVLKLLPGERKEGNESNNIS